LLPNPKMKGLDLHGTTFSDLSGKHYILNELYLSRPNKQTSTYTSCIYWMTIFLMMYLNHQTSW